MRPVTFVTFAVFFCSSVALERQKQVTIEAVPCGFGGTLAVIWLGLRVGVLAGVLAVEFTTAEKET